MNVLRRWFAVTVTLLLLCSLAACAKPENPSGSGSDWSFVTPFSKGALSDQGYYYINSAGLLSFADFAVGDSVILCSTVGCDHKDCDADIPGANPARIMFFWNDHLYYIADDIEGIRLYRRDAAGLSMEIVGSLGEKYVKEHKSTTIYNYALGGAYLYYTVQVYGSAFDEQYGTNTTKHVLDCVCRLNLQTGSEEILAEESIDTPAEKLQLIAARNDGILFVHWEGTDVDKSDPGYLDAFHRSAVTLHNWNAQTGQTSTVLQKSLSQFSDIKMITGSKLYYLVTSTAAEEIAGNHYAYDLTTGQETIVSGEILWHLGGGYAQLFDRETGECCLYHLETEKTLPNALNELSNSAGTLRAVSEKGFVLEWSGKQKYENPDDHKLYSTLYLSYVTYASLADGLQNEDLVILYTRESLTS